MERSRSLQARIFDFYAKRAETADTSDGERSTNSSRASDELYPARITTIRRNTILIVLTDEQFNTLKRDKLEESWDNDYKQFASWSDRNQLDDDAKSETSDDDDDDDEDDDDDDEREGDESSTGLIVLTEEQFNTLKRDKLEESWDNDDKLFAS